MKKQIYIYTHTHTFPPLRNKQGISVSWHQPMCHKVAVPVHLKGSYFSSPLTFLSSKFRWLVVPWTQHTVLWATGPAHSYWFSILSWGFLLSRSTSSNAFSHLAGMIRCQLCTCIPFGSHHTFGRIFSLISLDQDSLCFSKAWSAPLSAISSQVLYL